MKSSVFGHRYQKRLSTADWKRHLLKTELLSSCTWPLSNRFEIRIQMNMCRKTKAPCLLAATAATAAGLLLISRDDAI